MATSFTFTVGAYEPPAVPVLVSTIRNRVHISVNGGLVIDSGGNLGVLMPNVFDF